MLRHVFSRLLPGIKPRRTTASRRMSPKRIARYYRHRISRLPGTPETIAMGFAIGMGVSVTPFIGFHILMGLALVLLFRASTMGMILGTVVGGNPWTYPFIWVTTFHLGRSMLSLMMRLESRVHEPRPTMTFSTLWHHPVDLLLPMTVGSLPVALGVGIVSYYLLRPFVARYHSQRRERLTAASRRRAATVAAIERAARDTVEEDSGA